MDLRTEAHEAVPHPDSFIKNGKKTIRHANDWAALKLAAFYGAAVTIWLFALYTLLGAVFTKQQPTLLYWSNGAQLVFCPLMVYVGNLISKQANAKKEADHIALTHLANTGDEIHALLELVAEHSGAVDCHECSPQPIEPISNPNYDRAKLEQMADDFDTMTISSHSEVKKPVEC